MTTYSTDPALFIFTSLTAGSSHIVTATSRLETILRANRVPFKAVDLATDEKARMLWGRRAGKDESGRVRKLPALIQEGLVLGDLVEIEDWNEYGELKQHVKIYYDEFTIPNIHHKHPEPVFKKRPVKKSAAAASASATPAAAASSNATTATAGKAAPVPPPMPEPKAATATPTEKKTSADKTLQAGKETTLPVRSVADEAAAKAKELRLKSLREKVHGKEGAAEIEKAKKAEAEGKSATTPAPAAAPAPAPAPAPAKKADEEEDDDDDDDDDSDESSEEESSEEDSEEDSSDEDEAPKTQAKPTPIATKPPGASSSSAASTGTKPPGLQSPTSSAWRHGSESDDLARDALQSPTSGKWAQGATVGETLGTHNGAELRTASEAEIKALEKENVIKEEPELEEKEEKKDAEA